jgi:ADP-heptose:LPS heptosyltransferase
LGDVLLCTPTLTLLKGRFPEAQIDFLTKPYSARAVEGNPNLNRVWALDVAWAKTLTNQTGGAVYTLVEILPILRREQYDLGIDLQGHFRNARLLSQAKVKVKLGPDWRGGRHYLDQVQNPDLHHHARLQNQQVLLPLGCSVEAQLPTQFVPNVDEDTWHWAKRYRGALVIHPGAAHPAKRWPLERFLQVAQNGAKDFTKVCFLEGPGDPILPSMMVENDDGEQIELEVLKGLSLDELGAVLSGSSVFLSNDTGTAHLAQGVACPTLVLFGATDPLRFGPKKEFGHDFCQSSHPLAPCWWPEKGLKHPDIDFIGTISVEEVTQKVFDLRYKSCKNGR